MKAVCRALVSLVVVLLLLSAVPTAFADAYPKTIEEVYEYAGFGSYNPISFSVGPDTVIGEKGAPDFTDEGYLAYYTSLFIEGAEDAIFSYRFDGEDQLYMVLIDINAPAHALDAFIKALCESGVGETIQPDKLGSLHACNADTYILEFPHGTYAQYAYMVVEYGEPYCTMNLILAFGPDFKATFYQASAPFYSSVIKTTGSVNVREKPSLDAKNLGSLAKGATAQFLGASAKDDRGVMWYKIAYKNGSGWVSSKYSEFGSTAQSPQNTGVNETSYALVTDAYQLHDRAYATFDYVELHFYSPGKKNAKGETMDHEGVDIVNNNPKLRTYEIAENCQFLMPQFYSLEYIDLSKNNEVSFAFFQEHYADIAYGDRPMIFHVTIVNSKVVKCELWRDYYIGG